MADDQKAETYTEAETEARREAALQVMFKTPHKPQQAKKHETRRNRSGDQS